MPEEDVERKGVFADQVRTFKADTLEELAVKIGQDPATFVKTVEDYNALCEAGTDTEFGKDPKYLIPVKQAPFYGIHRRMRCSTICAGLEVNGETRRSRRRRADRGPVRHRQLRRQLLWRR